MKIVWTEPARQDLREIFTYIAEENTRAARALLTEIKERVGVLKTNPEIGRTGDDGNPIYPSVSLERPTNSNARYI